MLLSLAAALVPVHASAVTTEDHTAQYSQQLRAQLAGLEQQLREDPDQLMAIATRKDAIDQSLPALYTEAAALSQQLSAYTVLSPENQEPLATLDDLVAQQVITSELEAIIANRQASAARARAIEEETRRWHSPLVKDTEVVSPYGYRIHPVYGYRKFHSGVDLDAEKGDLIVAARAGVVTTAKYSRTGGYYVVIDHGDGFTSEYLHMTDYIVTVGQSVSVGETIGYVGRSGVATGAHLHFGIKLDGETVNPEDYLTF